MLGSRGQQFTVFQLLIGAVFALALLSIAYSVVVSVTEYQPGSDVLSVSGELLASAYSAAGTGESFSREARLQPQFFSTDSLRAKGGLPIQALIGIHCNEDYCEPKCEYEEGSVGQGCTEISLVAGAEVWLCATCEDPSRGKTRCHLFIGEGECSSLL